jgi:hypothetical protein
MFLNDVVNESTPPLVSRLKMVQATPKVHAGEAVMGFIDKFYEHTPGFQV